ncbi:hypothetical protein J7F01_13690 [Streptomyces sp. ISL-22]|uniref:Secreted protein n=1 Tax=Streptomyces curacoi TaxID=146536 RepID=A0A117P537_9ACTN|nr:MULTISPECIES: DUF6479 family protein [Streptomyces]KUM73251.1 hypothetical protein AQI70_20980 [Streptomyces curacoi]MBT2420159.1 hypothetical protein [Streptomyces sp. ISL-24]MBT2433227.1 hypothetical protein [Streptomyces sp. ISL-22]
MNIAWMEMAAEGALGIGLLVAGLVVVALLIGAFVLGVRVRRREPAPPRPEEQPQVPEGGPVGEVRENRVADEMPRSDHRLTPHELPAHGNIPSRPSPSKERPRWDEGSSGSFGSGGSGRT